MVKRPAPHRNHRNHRTLTVKKEGVMRVIMKEKIQGFHDGEPWPAPGGVVDLPDNEAEELINVGIADRVTNQEVPESNDPKPGNVATGKPAERQASATVPTKTRKA